jgi:2-polyprenyl-3-methyl-5-hydroxy-6-metoxy-1,4-benzoquinol methylase
MAFKFGNKPDPDLLKLSTLRELVAPTKGTGQPNINGLTQVLNRIDSLSLSVKFFGYELARTLAEALPACNDVALQEIDIACKPSTQADIAADWVGHWCGQLHIPRVFHRKVWELTYVLQAIHRHGSLRPGARGLGFGCGQEPIPSYLASRGVAVTVTDQPPEQMLDQGWSETNQHTRSLDDTFHGHLVDRETFDRQVALRYVDMNAIDEDLADFDFCWSVCAFEHLGSIEQGLAFVENSLKTVRPGGLSVHTTEYNFANATATIDNWSTVLFQRRHFEELARRLTEQGHSVAPLDFDVGHLPLDKFIDVPPYHSDWNPALKDAWENDGTPHLKMTIDGFASTCFGFTVRRAE